MKLATALISGAPRPVVIDQQRAWDVCTVRSELPTRLGDWVTHWDALRDSIADNYLAAPNVPLAGITLTSPLDTAGKILCVGRNYAAHALEQGAEIPTEPVIFSKLNTALNGPNQPIRLPPISHQVDYEGELVVVMGETAKNVADPDAMNHVFGYCCGNDVTARDWQKGRPGGQWLLGKSFDTFGPIGPWITTADEFDRNPHLDISLKLNGELMQSSNTRHFMYPIDRLISHLSQFCTLEPGDLLFTGTPEGVGVARDPQVFLQSGDIMEVEIEGIGVLMNPVKGS